MRKHGISDKDLGDMPSQVVDKQRTGTVDSAASPHAHVNSFFMHRSLGKSGPKTTPASESTPIGFGGGVESALLDAKSSKLDGAGDGISTPIALTVRNINIGGIVQRGPDWGPDLADQDGGKGSKGRVLAYTHVGNTGDTVVVAGPALAAKLETAKLPALVAVIEWGWGDTTGRKIKAHYPIGLKERYALSLASPHANRRKLTAFKASALRKKNAKKGGTKSVGLREEDSSNAQPTPVLSPDQIVKGNVKGNDSTNDSGGATVTRSELIEFYQQHDPGKVGSVDTVLKGLPADKLLQVSI